MSASIKKNFLYNILLQLVTLLLPIVTVPYVSRVLGKDKIGTYGYTTAIVQSFIIIGTMGILFYGNRAIAYVRDDKEKMSRTFWSILTLNIITTGIAFIVYLFVYGFDKEYGYVYLIQSVNIVAAMIDISWLYMGLEDFKKTVTRNMAVKILGVICVFLFVKSPQDLELYVAIYALMTLFGNLAIWVYVPKTVSLVKIKFSDVMSHFIPALQLFLPQVAIQIYAILDKAMLGKLSDVGEVGLYEQSQKIIKLVLSLVTSLGVVMLPRMSNIFANGDNEKMKDYLNNSLRGITYICIPMAFGLAGISNEFVPWFFGSDFTSVSYLMISLTPIVYFIAMGNVFGVQYLLPINKTKEFTTSVLLGAIVNVILNLILIPKYKALGSCIATVASECVVSSIQYMYIRKDIRRKEYFVNLLKYVLASAIMFVVVRLIGINMGANILTTALQSAIGVIIYVVILALFRDETNKFIFKIILAKANDIKLKILNLNN